MTRLKSIFYLVGISILLISCSEDEPAPDANELEGLQVGIFENENITVPNAMAASSDPYAGMASNFVNVSTTFNAYGAFFEVPAGATKRDQPVTAVNGRIAAIDYKVYEWSGQDGYVVAYQYSVQDEQEVFEIFLKESGSDYFKILEARQNNDGKRGTMTWYGQDGETAVWTWEIDDDGNYFLTFSSEGAKYEVISNNDRSGSVKYYTNGILETEIHWDSAGNGSWKEYDGTTVTNEGEWTV